MKRYARTLHTRMRPTDQDQELLEVLRRSRVLATDYDIGSADLVEKIDAQIERLEARMKEERHG